MTQRDALTFGLAFLGYCLLGATVAVQARGLAARGLRTLLALVLPAHVFLVWHWRFDWSLDAAVRKSVLGFALFHGALLAIIAAAFLGRTASRRVLAAAFLVVSAAAVPAPWRYREIAALRVPMIAACAGAIAAWLWSRRRARD